MSTSYVLVNDESKEVFLVGEPPRIGNVEVSYVEAYFKAKSIALMIFLKNLGKSGMEDQRIIFEIIVEFIGVDI